MYIKFDFYLRLSHIYIYIYIYIHVCIYLQDDEEEPMETEATVSQKVTEIMKLVVVVVNNIQLYL